MARLHSVRVRGVGRRGRRRSRGGHELGGYQECGAGVTSPQNRDGDPSEPSILDASFAKKTLRA